MDDYYKYQLESEIIELDIHLVSSVAMSIELHFKYRKEGFTPTEFYSYITGKYTKNNIENWSDAVMQLALFFEQIRTSNAIH
tara:strand:+ start:314 stop:559 length:246 start_codon:yes stop_codon:yes gene_type:complete